MEYDIIVIGGGVTGCSIARYLTQYEASVCILEKNGDVCTGSSKANSGIVHAGYDPVPGTLKAELNVRGNQLIRELKDILGIDVRNNGAMVLSLEESGLSKLEDLYNRGIANGVPGMELLSRDEVLRREPNLTKEVKGALYLGTSCVVCPFSLTIAMAENAIANGAVLETLSEVTGIEKKGGRFLVTTTKGVHSAKVVINAAGLYSDKVNAMVADESFTIEARRGEYVLLDKSEGKFVNATMFQLPSALGKGVLVSPTVHGNLLVGPDSETVLDREDNSTRQDRLDYIMQMAKVTAPGLNYRKIITSFAGLRAHLATGGDDFILNSPVEGFYNAAGIESPGLTSAPAIGEKLSAEIADYLKLGKKASFNQERRRIPQLCSMDRTERNELIKGNPRYGNIICRCEEISEGEIVDAVHRGARTLDGVKRRVRAGMGRCQAGFCSPKVLEIISRETGLPMEEICKNEPGSEVCL